MLLSLRDDEKRLAATAASSCTTSYTQHKQWLYQRGTLASWHGPLRAAYHLSRVIIARRADTEAGETPKCIEKIALAAA